MCNLDTLKLFAWEVRKLTQHYKLIGKEWEEVIGARNDVLELYPNYEAPVVVMRDGKRVIETLRWGFPPFKQGAGYATNFRMLKDNLWRPWLDQEHRCIVPATAFAEPDRNTSKPVQWRVMTTN